MAHNPILNQKHNNWVQQNLKKHNRSEGGSQGLRRQRQRKKKAREFKTAELEAALPSHSLLPLLAICLHSHSLHLIASHLWEAIYPPQHTHSIHKLLYFDSLLPFFTLSATFVDIHNTAVVDNSFPLLPPNRTSDFSSIIISQPRKHVLPLTLCCCCCCCHCCVCCGGKSIRFPFESIFV